MKIAKRMDIIKTVFVAEMNMRLNKMREEGRDVINLGVGDPDFTPPANLLQVLTDEAQQPDHHHYPSFYPNRPLKEAIAGWYRRRFSVDLDPNTEVLPLLGSTDGLFLIHLCLLDPGDVALVPDPSYPSYEVGVKLMGGQVEWITLSKENGFLPDLDSIPTDIARRAKMFWINYPNNPTGAVATPDFYKKLITFAQTFEVIVVSDNAYSEIYFDGRRPVSFLEFPGAKDVGVELHSLSKTFNCCGWRAGMLVGNKDIISGMTKIKSHSDRGMFYPLQVASLRALNSSLDFIQERNQAFQERRDVVVKGLRGIGLEVFPPQATFYLWARVPPGYTSQDFCLQALEQSNVWMIPGSVYGKYGEGYLRIALTQPVERMAEAMERLKKITISS